MSLMSRHIPIALLGFLTAIDAMTIDMNLPSMPVIASEFSIDNGGVQKTLAFFLFVLAVFQGVLGYISDAVGRRRTLFPSLAIYVIGSVLCAIGETMEVFTVGRGLQAIGAAAGIVLPRAVIADLVQGQEAAKALSMLMVILGVVPLVAPGVGSLVMSFSGWRWIFHLQALLGVAALIWAFLSLPETRQLMQTQEDDVQGKSESGLLDVSFLLNSFCSSLCFGAMFSYIASMPFIFSKHDQSIGNIGIIAGVISSGFLLGAKLSTVLLRRVRAETIVVFALITQPVTGVLIAVSGLWDQGNNIMGVASAFFFMVIVGLLLGNTVAIALKRINQRVGAASSIIGVMQFFVGGVSVFIASSISAQGLIGPLIVILTFFALAFYVLAWQYETDLENII